MKKAIFVSLGANDRMTVDGRTVLAAKAGVSPAAVAYLADLAEHALHPEDGVIADRFAVGDGIVVGCSRPRAVQALLSFAGLTWQEWPIEWVSLPFDRETLKRGYGVPWYPVIDHARCAGCGTCLDYCLFSVYGRDKKGLVRVQTPLNCKTGCPACARLCPEAAVIFPFCEEAELNGEISQPARRSREMLAEVLGDDPMRILADRRKKKQLIDPAKFEQAEKDRILYSGVL